MSFLKTALCPRAALAQFVGAEVDDLVFVPNTTSGVNTILRSLTFVPEDELLVTSHKYAACLIALNYDAERSGMRAVVMNIPFLLHCEDEILARVLTAVRLRTRLALPDHVSSLTRLGILVEKLVRELGAPGMAPLNVTKKRRGLRHQQLPHMALRPERCGVSMSLASKQNSIRPLGIGNGASSSRKDRSRLQINFAWTVTSSPAAYLCVLVVLKFMGSLLPDGWPEIMVQNRPLAIAARKVLGAELNVSEPYPRNFLARSPPCYCRTRRYKDTPSTRIRCRTGCAPSRH